MMYLVAKHLTNMVIVTNPSFSKHEPCPRCGSRDNLGRWEDGHAYCFGCFYYEPPQHIRSIAHKPEVVKRFPDTLVPWPEDTQVGIGQEGWTWLKKYGIMEAETKNFRWSDSKKWLIMPIYSVANKEVLIGWQARNFNKDRPKPKYITHGRIGHLYHPIGPEKDMIILVEDYLSAIKVGRFYTTQPLWGSNISLELLTVLQKRFKRLGIWLDMDKASESLKTHSRASQLGFDKIYSIITEKDPKEYNDEEIIKIVEAKTAT